MLGMEHKFGAGRETRATADLEIGATGVSRVEVRRYVRGYADS